MKKLLLSFTALIFAAGANAQSCTPGANFADSTYGAWPDTIINFPPAAAGVFYSTDLNFKVPDQVTADLDDTGLFVGSPIQDFTVTGVTGLPTGLNYACNIGSCTYVGGANGCANLYGTTSVLGTHDVVINVDATIIIDIPFVGPTPQTQATSFQGYKIVVGTAGLIEQVLAPISVYPNPASDFIKINGLSNAYEISRVDLIAADGSIISSDLSGSITPSFDVSALENGIYMVKVYSQFGVSTCKFIK